MGQKRIQWRRDKTKPRPWPDFAATAAATVATA